MVAMTLSERKLGEAGLAEAHQRLADRIGDPVAGDPLLSLAETLTWCYVLETAVQKNAFGIQWKAHPATTMRAHSPQLVA
jgi:hypothetical protein